jgi:hypothetical protein
MVYPISESRVSARENPKVTTTNIDAQPEEDCKIIARSKE